MDEELQGFVPVSMPEDEGQVSDFSPEMEADAVPLDLDLDTEGTGATLS